MEQTSRVPLKSIYRVFFEIGLFSFGGAVSGWIQREVVEVRKWMSHEDFLSGIALAQIMPGANATNSAVYVGQRLRGVAGAATALAAMMTGPFCAIVIAAMTYQTLLKLPGFQQAMIGTAAAAVGMLLRTSVTSARLSARGLVPALVMAATFVAVGIFRLPLLAVICVVAPVSVGLAFWASERRG
jgi:chromate transporter